MEVSYRFPLSEVPRWRRHLEEEGYVVVANALRPVEVDQGRDFLWTDLEDAYKVSRSNLESWNAWPLSRAGLNTKVTQDRGAWYVRARPGVKETFSHIWSTDQLIVSMDALIIWRPWWLNSKWTPQTEGLHLDQNPFSKPGLETVQGMVPLLPVTPATGGLEVVARSHTAEAKDRLCRECPIHGGRVGTGQVPEAQPDPELARLSVTVCMVPRARASEDVLQQRRAGFLKGVTFNHSPHEAGTSTGTLQTSSRKRHSLTELDEDQLALL